MLLELASKNVLNAGFAKDHSLSFLSLHWSSESHAVGGISAFRPAFLRHSGLERTVALRTGKVC